MHTLYLTFTDRAEALSTLASTLGYATTAEAEGGRELFPTGDLDGTRYDLDFLADGGVRPEGGLVNVLWWGEPSAAPDFGAAAITPASPSCIFAL